MVIRPGDTYISLFTGAGGLDLAVRILAPDTRCVCYVERELAAATLLATRARQGALDDAPVWSDVCTFDGRPWRGRVAGIVGGFPCQDLSVAGKRAGIQRGNRSGLFYEYMRIVREVQPDWVALENVRAVLAFPAGGIVLGELASMGFDAEWGSLEACDVGASHERHRKFILAYRASGHAQRGSWDRRGNRARRTQGQPSVSPCTRSAALEHTECAERRPHADTGASAGEGKDEQGQAAGWAEKRSVAMDHASSFGRPAGRNWHHGQHERNIAHATCSQLGHADDPRLEGRRHLTGQRGDERPAVAAGVRVGQWALGPADPRWADVLVRYPWLRPALSQAEAESGVCRMADGLATVLDGRIDRLRLCGNGVVPLQGAAVLAELQRRIAADGE